MPLRSLFRKSYQATYICTYSNDGRHALRLLARTYLRFLRSSFIVHRSRATTICVAAMVLLFVVVVIFVVVRKPLSSLLSKKWHNGVGSLFWSINLVDAAGKHKQQQQTATICVAAMFVAVVILSLFESLFLKKWYNGVGLLFVAFLSCRHNTNNNNNSEWRRRNDLTVLLYKEDATINQYSYDYFYSKQSFIVFEPQWKEIQWTTIDRHPTTSRDIWSDTSRGEFL